MNEISASGASTTVRSLPLAISVVLGVAGGRLLLAGTSSAISAGVLLIVAALGGLGVALGSLPFGPSEEGPIDLSTRIGLGLLGGLLAGLLHGVMTEAAGWLGVASALGAGIDVDLSPMEWWNRSMLGSVWGLSMGLVWKFLPGPGHVLRGAAFGLLLALGQLFFVYPVRLGLGIAGVDVGLGVVPFVLFGMVVSGAVAGQVIGWGGRMDLAPLSAHLVD
ncbi:MAG: hypothetical protein E4H28_06600 [Gemmatimonadales bacterium]|nr:MAG: hypothetical protein E4H28_06600 [Gemmatimonadales bacterium]